MSLHSLKVSVVKTLKKSNRYRAMSSNEIKDEYQRYHFMILTKFSYFLYRHIRLNTAWGDENSESATIQESFPLHGHDMLWKHLFSKSDSQIGSL